MKKRNFYLKTFSFSGEIFNIFEKACFRNDILHAGLKNSVDNILK